MRDALRHFLAEFVGTFAYVFLGGASVLAATGGNGNLLTVAATHGLILAVMVSALMRVSGHFNPAVTLGFLVTRRMQPMMAALYVVAQLVAAMAAAYALKGIFPAELYAAARGATPSIAISLSGAQAFLVEGVATFLLMWVVFGTAVDPQAPRVGGFAIGLTITAAMLALGPLTGGMLNPARAFGPAVAAGVFEGQFVYWAGPIVGAILAAVVYDTIFLPRSAEEPGSGAVQPARGKGARREHAV